MPSNMDTSPSGELPASKAELSEREIEILRWVATGVSNKEIAQKLVISPNTVKVHLRNIFAKIGVASRTEAAMYAIREGVVQMEMPTPPNAVAAPETVVVPEPIPSPVLPAHRPSRLRWIIAEVVVLALLLLTPLAWRAMNATSARPTLAAPPTPTAQPRWQEKAPLPEARAGLAVAAYENLIYAIGGETAVTITGRLDRYDPATDAWVTLTSKPISVTDINAAVIGGRIYVPGGKMASGVVTSTMEVYDPRTNTWEPRAPLPVALSAYAMVAFEGKLYVFGGWDGERYLATTYEYDPSRDAWVERTPMPTARGFAGAAVAGGRIYVVGGTDGKQALAVNEEYSLEDGNSITAWRTRAPLPRPRTNAGSASLADIVYIVGGQDAAVTATPLEYLASNNSWQIFEVPPKADVWPRTSVTAIGSRLFVMGGLSQTKPSARNFYYQALYTIALPVVQ
jgi:DNA-binding CsgD family transcriptional regulator